MGLRYRDLVVDLVCQAPPKPCGCTATGYEPACGRGSQKPPNQGPPKPKPGPKPSKRTLSGLEALRHQLRSELRAQG